MPFNMECQKISPRPPKRVGADPIRALPTYKPRTATKRNQLEQIKKFATIVAVHYQR